MSLKDFYNTYKGQKNVGNTAANKGQCVGLASLWMDNFSIPHVWGDAKDIYANAPDEYFVKVPNTPDAIIQDGDIPVWSGGYNTGPGHIGVAYGKHDVNNFDCFQQNDPLGSTPHIKRYNYAYIIGWLRPKAYHGESTPELPQPNPGYAPTFVGQTVEKEGMIYESYEKDGQLLWTVREKLPEPNPGYMPDHTGQTVEKDGIIYESYEQDGKLLWIARTSTQEENPPESQTTGSESTSVETSGDNSTSTETSTSEGEVISQPENPDVPSNGDLKNFFQRFFEWLINYLKKYVQ